MEGDDSGGCGKGLFTCNDDGANAPWAWDDRNDGLVHAGEMALDPAHLVEVYFDNLGNFDPNYLRNPYVQTLKDRGFGITQPLPRGWSSRLNLLVLYNKLLPSSSSSTSIPEPSFVAGLLTFGILGAGSLLKGKQKQQK